jgi:hypothetical protein
VKDDTAALQSALDEASKAGGGVIHFPRGRYRLSEGLTISRHTVLRGETRERTALCWTDLPSPPEALLLGTNSFGIEHVAASVEAGVGVTLYVNGRQAAHLDNTGRRVMNTEPLIIGREAWGGDPPDARTPGFFTGRIDEVKIWTRPLTAEEIRAEYERRRE